MGAFLITKRKNGEFQFVLKAGNGEVILSSEGYSSKTNCTNGIESVKRNSKDDSKFEKLEAKDGRLYFNLKATNGQIIGSSQMYASASGRDNGIESVKKNAPEAETKEDL
jgi:uncharacterized protein YegP (UPF0339 family)